jgi:hypothetical protein
VSLRLIAAMVVIAVLLATHWKAYTEGGKDVRSEWTAAIAQANAEARSLEQARQRRADEAGRLAAAREAGLRADAARSANAVRGLRDELAALKSRSQSDSPETQRTSAIGELLAECSEAYRSLAERADRHVNDLRLLQEAWPK